MGMYTELIFGAELKKDTPNVVIASLEYMMGERKEKPEGFPFSGRGESLFAMSSYSFGVNEAISKIWFDDNDGQYHISTRSNIKNYSSDIEKFLSWIEPYIDGGSGERDMYAIVIYEDATEPDIYYKYPGDWM